MSLPHSPNSTSDVSMETDDKLGARKRLPLDAQVTQPASSVLSVQTTPSASRMAFGSFNEPSTGQTLSSDSLATVARLEPSTPSTVQASPSVPPSTILPALMFGSADLIPTSFAATNAGPPQHATLEVRGPWAYDRATGAILHTYGCPVCTAYRNEYALASQQASAPLDPHIRDRESQYYETFSPKIKTECDHAYDKGARDERAEAKCRISAAVKDADDQRARADRLDSSLDKLEEDFADLKSDYNDLRDEHDDIVRQRDDAIRERDEAVRDRDDIAREGQGDSDQLDSLERGNEELVKAKDDLLKKVAALQKANKGLREALKQTGTTPRSSHPSGAYQPVGSSSADHMRNIHAMLVPLAQRLAVPPQATSDVAMADASDDVVLPYDTPPHQEGLSLSDAPTSGTSQKSKKRKLNPTKKGAPPLVQGPAVYGYDGVPVQPFLNVAHASLRRELRPETWTPGAPNPFDYVRGHEDINQLRDAPWGAHQQALYEHARALGSQLRTPLQERWMQISNAHFHQAYKDRTRCTVGDRPFSTTWLISSISAISPTHFAFSGNSPATSENRQDKDVPRSKPFPMDISPGSRCQKEAIKKEEDDRRMTVGYDQDSGGDQLWPGRMRNRALMDNFLHI